ncbi:MAG: type II toxin-antitoxin system prevent-host-death family antitoxin [Acidimicrobiales bacterium]|nr:type II toxin-antitoxin system prevent-host-death family antitoxin [Acidimicrobiales bacterium]
MAREITQRELRNQSGEIMRALDDGQDFVVTRNGVPVGQLVPFPRQQFVNVDVVTAMFRGAPAVDGDRLRADLDRVTDQSIAPRA